MANEDRKPVAGDGGKVNPGGKPAKPDSNSSTAGTNTGTGTGTGTATDAGTGTNTGTVKEKKPVEVAILTPPTKEEAGQAAKPTAKRKRPAKKKNETNAEMATQICALLQSVSMFAASRPNMAHWAISEAEAMSIAEPLTNIIEKSETLSKVAEHSDGIALVTACMMVFAPRAAVSVQQAQKKKAKPKLVMENKGGEKKHEQSGKNNSAGGRNDSTVADVHSTISEAIPATVGLF